MIGSARAAGAAWDQRLATPAVRWARVLALVATGLLLVWAFALGSVMLRNALSIPGAIGFDLTLYLERTQSWLDGTAFYLPRQLTGQPYTVMDGDAMYPPVFMVLMLPWTIGAPAFLWWAIPLSLLGFSIAKMRPSVWAAPFLAFMLAHNQNLVGLICGNPAMWAYAFLAAGLVWKWPAALLLFKTNLAPFALIGIRDRRWWAVAALGTFVSLAFVRESIDYVGVLVNARASLEYVIGSWLTAGCLAAVYLTGRRHRASRDVAREKVDQPGKYVAAG